METVYCAVRVESLNVIHVNRGRAVNSGVLSLATHCGGLGSIPGQSIWHFLWTDRYWGRFSSEGSSFRLSLSFHQCSVPIFFYLRTSYSFQKNICEKHGNLPKINPVSEICQHWVEKYFHLVLEGLTVCFKCWCAVDLPDNHIDTFVFSTKDFTVITNVWITNACLENDVQNRDKVKHRRGQGEKTKKTEFAP